MVREGTSSNDIVANFASDTEKTTSITTKMGDITANEEEIRQEAWNNGETVEPMEKGASMTPTQPIAQEQQGSPMLQKITLGILVFLVAYLFLVLFSGINGGYGDKVYELLSAQSGYFYAVAGVSACMGLFLYCADAWYWDEGYWIILSRILSVLTIIGFSLTALLLTKSFAAAPFGVFFMGAPGLFMLYKKVFYPTQALTPFLRTLIAHLSIMTIIVATGWTAWLIVGDNWWNEENKQVFYNRMQCENTTKVYISKDEDGNFVEHEELTGCTAAFLLWLAPFILGVWGFAFALVLYFLVRAYVQAQSEKGAQVDPLLQVFISFMILGLMGIWAAAGIAGAEMGISNVVLALSFVGLIISGVVVISVFGAGYVKDQVTKQPLGHRLIVSMKSDWAKALMLLLTAPFFLFYLVLSVLNQFSRKYFRCTKTLEEDELRLVLTKSAHNLVVKVYNWEWSSVLIKSIWWGIAFFVMMVGVGRAVTVFMSWLNETLLPVHLGITIGVFYFVGAVMFLLPPVPGVPVYLAGGVIVTKKLETDTGMNFWVAVAITCLICFTIKLLAIVLQQKVIGERMASSNVKVRQFVGINSIQIRAVRRILEKPGFTTSKVMVLIGGPDWPTSVLTGILHMRLSSMILGSLPVFFLIAPCCMAGAMLLKKEEGGTWESLATIALTLAFVVQSFALLSAFHFIEKVAHEIQKEDDGREVIVDQEVYDLDQKVLIERERRKSRMAWSKLGFAMRGIIIVGAITMAISCYMFQLMSAQCFKAFEITDSIDSELDGNVFSIVLPAGRVALLLWSSGIAMLVVTIFYAKSGSKNTVVANDALAPAQGVDAEANHVVEKQEPNVATFACLACLPCFRKVEN